MTSAHNGFVSMPSLRALTDEPLENPFVAHH